MPPKKKSAPKPRKNDESAVIANAGLVINQPITDTLEKNFMPYAMSVIVSRAIPDIDGFKPSHRKILYTMYKMGLLGSTRTKSANIVGQTMKLNPHGDQAIYETMVRLARGNEALLHPYVDSKGNFGKAYSRDMSYAASRYTEAKLTSLCKELFADIDFDTVDFVDNYDGTMKEPTMLPVTFPTLLVNSNIGIAVGMASSICSFNLAEVCETTIALMRNPQHDIMSTLKAPDFSSGGFIVYNEDDLRKIYQTGRGGVKVRARYNYDKTSNCIDITEIPPTTTVEAIIDRVVELIKGGKIREISDMRDETDLKGLKLTIDLRRGVDAEALMQKLYRMTPLEDSFSCNFNILIGGNPRVMGIAEIINEWIAFRRECIRRRVFFRLGKHKDKLHLLQGLSKILLDIDKAVKIVRETEQESEVVPNLMIGFGIDEIQADYVAQIRLRHLNREYILKRTQEIESLKNEIAEMEDILANPKRVNKIIIDELKEVSKQYGQQRKSLLYYPTEEDHAEIEEEVPDYPCIFFFTSEGYFKKVTPQSLRMSNDNKLKEGDKITQEVSGTNRAELLFFTNKHQVYKADASDFEDTRASDMGEYLSAKLDMDAGESAIFMVVTYEYDGYMLFFFENGKAAKVSMDGYQTKTKRRKLVGAYNDKSPLVNIFHLKEDIEFILRATNSRTLIANSAAINAKASRSTLGVQVMSLRKNTAVDTVQVFTEDSILNDHRFRTKTLPAAGSFPRKEDLGEQLSL